MKLTGAGGNIRSGTRWFVPLILFIATVATTLFVGGEMWNVGDVLKSPSPGLADIFKAGVPYAAPLLLILVCHEMGHFITGKVHRLKVSLPYFIPVPFFLGTMGAFIIYRSKIDSARKLLDVGVAGPLAGIAVATALMILGLNLSEVKRVSPGMGLIFQEGQSIYYLFLKWIVFGRIPAGYDVFLHPVAWSAWIGLFITMINLCPVGQLDGGHVAYALLGPRQNLVSAFLHVSMLALAAAIGLHYAGAALIEGRGAEHVLQESLTGGFWVVWALVLYILKRIGRGYHPPVLGDAAIGRGRALVGIATLLLFLLLFMPVPLRVVEI